ncbi:MAG: hypothetical protein FWD55_08180, partial [Propionibacteriaceae bacterium]|nr:hypothetical protein [Propionibacteriaceae bacterium]
LLIVGLGVGYWVYATSPLIGLILGILSVIGFGVVVLRVVPGHPMLVWLLGGCRFIQIAIGTLFLLDIQIS